MVVLQRTNRVKGAIFALHQENAPTLGMDRASKKQRAVNAARR